MRPQIPALNMTQMRRHEEQFEIEFHGFKDYPEVTHYMHYTVPPPETDTDKFRTNDSDHIRYALMIQDIGVASRSKLPTSAYGQHSAPTEAFSFPSSVPSLCALNSLRSH